MNNILKHYSLPLKFTTVFIGFIIASCEPQYHSPVSYVSPGGTKTVDIVSEDQLSNDPDPFWQHVSIRESKDTVPIVPGNLFAVSMYEQPIVTWLNQDTVIIEFKGRFGQSFNKKEIKSRLWNGVFIETVIENDKRNDSSKRKNVKQLE